MLLVVVATSASRAGEISAVGATCSGPLGISGKSGNWRLALLPVSAPESIAIAISLTVRRGRDGRSDSQRIIHLLQKSDAAQS